MMKFIQSSKFGLGALVVATVVSVASAQETQKRKETKQTQPGKAQPAQRDTAQQSQAGEMDANRLLASCVAINNQHEIAMSQFALPHIQNAEVKEFTQMLIDEHTAFATKLAQFAPETANMKLESSGKNRGGSAETGKAIQQTSASDDANPQRDPAQNKTQKKSNVTTASAQSDNQTATGSNSGPINEDKLLSIERRVAEECLAMQEKELTESKASGDFDHAFLACQIGAHVGMIAKLNVFEQEADGELAKVLSEGRESSQKHLIKAKNLITSVSKDK